MKITELLGKRMLICDGAMGTMLQAAGLKPGELPEAWNILYPEKVKSVHSQYIASGCDIVITNTFGANAIKLKKAGYDADKIACAAIDIAKAAVKESGRECFVAFDIGPTGKLLEPLGDLSFEEAYDIFSEMASAAQAHGADLIIIETMSDTYELKAAVLAAKENTTLPVFATAVFDKNHKLLTGADAAAVVTMLEGLGVDALGINCGLGPKQMHGLLKEFRAFSSLPIIINPNAGLPKIVDGNTVFEVTPDEFAQELSVLADMGAWIIGGCCGTTPAHISKVVELCANKPIVPLPEHALTVVSSYRNAVILNNDTKLIGERINPTGRTDLKRALKSGDYEFIVDEGITQQQNGAHILDVNVGLPGIDESKVLCEVTAELQGVCPLPLQLDTSNYEALEKAARIYNGKPMINSVNGKRSSMEAVFPIAKKYGGVIVALTLDENGIPDSAEGRVAIAEKILNKAKEYGIKPNDIVFDALTLTISTGSKNAYITLETLRLLREKLNAAAILGVSNISFGLPQRSNIDSVFFAMALNTGLSAAIINTESEKMRSVFEAWRALAGYDTDCGNYIKKYAGDVFKSIGKTENTDGSVSLYHAVVTGLKDNAYQAAKNALESSSPLDVVNSILVPALNEVGDGYEAQIVFLPQLLMSAEAANAAFKAVREALERNSMQQIKKGSIILATVKGDIHDIGKNIVKALLSNYGYEIIDMGKDVEPEAIVQAAERENIKLVGLSALMTTTVSSMEDTIKRLRARTPNCKIMVGGAVLTDDYAKLIGADKYCKDAMMSVRYAEEIFDLTL